MAGRQLPHRGGHAPVPDAAAHFIHFKCSVRRIADCPNLSGYLRDIYQLPGVSATVNMDHIKRHYYLSHRHLNPTGIIPAGPDVDFAGRHDRQRFLAWPPTPP